MSRDDNTPWAAGTPPLDSVPTIPEHTLLRRIGKGSYGEIWLARSALGAYRAVKIIHRTVLQDHEGAYEREFAGTAKFEPLSRQHEGLVQILQFGRGPNGRGEFFYYVMELADNVSHNSRPTPTPDDPAFPADYVPRTLAYEIITRAPLPAQEVLDLGERLGQALHFLHSQSLVHRDIKPSNIIFVGGQPKLADVGCVADLDNSLSAAGTVGYMPSEGPSTISADLFSVGKVLYEAATSMDRQDFPDLPTNLITGNSKPILELNEIWLKACANNPAERYDSAAHFLSDLNRLRGGKSLRSSRVRKRQLTLAAAVLGAVALIGTVVSSLRSQLPHSSPAPQPIRADDFNGQELDTKLWSITTNVWPGLHNTGHHQFKIVQTKGELTVAAYAQHELGYSTYAAALATLQEDFRKLDRCLVEVELTGTNEFGVLGVFIGDGDFPVDRGASRTRNTNSLPVLTSADHTIWHNRRVAIEFIPDQQAAVLYPDAQIHQDFEILDLARLHTWRLSFQAEANSSAVCRNGVAVLRLQNILAKVQSSPRPMIGHVADDLSGLPLPGANVVDQFGYPVGRAQANGAFMVIPETWPLHLRVEHDGYKPSAETEIPSEFHRPGHLTFELHKESFGFGDVVETFHYGDHDLLSIAFVDGKLHASVGKAKEQTNDIYIVPVDFTAKQIGSEIMRFHTGEKPFGSLVQCGNRLLALGPYPGRILELRPAGFSILFYPTNELNARMDWPWTGTFDGTNLWVIERDLSNNRVGLSEIDLQTHKILRHLPSADLELAGIAWDADGNQFWISTFSGRVFALDHTRALNGGTVQSAEGRTFRSPIYNILAFADGYLWGLSRGNQCIYKIKVRE